MNRYLRPNQVFQEWPKEKLELTLKTKFRQGTLFKAFPKLTRCPELGTAQPQLFLMCIDMSTTQGCYLLLLCTFLFLLAHSASSSPAESSYRVKRQDIPNGCDPNTGVGGFLIFPLLRAWCEEQGVTDFGVYGRRQTHLGNIIHQVGYKLLLILGNTQDLGEAS